MQTPSLSHFVPFVVVIACGTIACGPASPALPASGADAAEPMTDAAGDACPAGLAGAPCVLAHYDAAIVACDPVLVASVRGELDARAGLGPLWSAGRALFRTAGPIAVAGGWNEWSTTNLESTAMCGSDLFVAVGPVPTGYWQYKLVTGDTWSLDPANPAFAYDDFTGNPDGRNTVINTPDSGRGHVETLDRACSTALDNCRDVTAYLPAGYHAPEAAARQYPVLFLHDGQNVWSDHDCCFGHTGWELDVTLDAEIAAGRVAPVIAIAAAHSNARNAEYGLSLDAMTAFMTFQVTELQPQALAQVRGDVTRVHVAGSSLGGLVSVELALRYPQTYAGAASLSGAFWPNMETNGALRDHVAILGKRPVALYLDHGGDPSDNSDGAADTIEVRDLLIGLGWQRSCTPGPDAVCYHSEPGATHDELAWRARVWRSLQFLFPGT